MGFFVKHLEEIDDWDEKNIEIIDAHIEEVDKELGFDKKVHLKYAEYREIMLELKEIYKEPKPAGRSARMGTHVRKLKDRAQMLAREIEELIATELSRTHRFLR